MSNALSDRLETTQILLDLQQATEIVRSLAGCLEPQEIARRVTDGLVARFDCAFARLWLLVDDRSVLQLVASSGLYTQTNGFFSRVPMGAYKVGKIAQNRVSFLSNNLAQEPWVGDRDWAIANNMNGFAGYPLVIGDRVVGVLAFFSHGRLEPEFLEVLQNLCAIVAIALDTVMQYQKERQTWSGHSTIEYPALSDLLVTILQTTRLTLIGTEQALSPAITFIFVQVAECLQQRGCAYGRLIYGEESVTLDALVPIVGVKSESADLNAQLEHFHLMLRSLGGELRTQISPNQRSIEIEINIPYIYTRTQKLSEREVEILTLLTQGDRDRDIADHLNISESTVKFHLNNVLAKLKVRNRYQAIHQALVNGWIQ